MPALISSPPEGGMGDPGIGNCDPYGTLPRPESALSGRIFVAGQLTLVMVQPQRGHSEPWPERQVVPQWEQVEAVAALPLAQLPQA